MTPSLMLKPLTAALLLVIVMSGCASETGVTQQIKEWSIFDADIQTIAVYKMKEVWRMRRPITTSKDTLRQDSLRAVEIINNLKKTGL